MKRFLKYILIVLLVIVATVSVAGCNLNSKRVVDVVKTADGISIEYSDGTSQLIEVKDGQDGKDAESPTISEIYEKYVEEYGECDYADFLKQYLSVDTDATAVTVNECLLSVMKVYTEFIEQFTYIGSGLRPSYGYYYDTSIYTGSAVLWSMDKSEGGYSYIVTNYHVVYDEKANVTHNGGSKLAKNVNCYLYGSEGAPVATKTVDENSYTVYDYGEYGISCELVGGSVETDVAVLRAKTSDILSVNPAVKPVTVASEYFVGETAIAIGNPEDGGISVTEGIVSVENEYISLNIDGTSRSYRSIRMDTAIYGGNSGGGLFNKTGKLIGIVNAGSNEDESINFAIPIEIVKGTVENILFYSGNPKKVELSRFIASELTSKNSKYVYDSNLGYGKIVEQVTVNACNPNSIAYNLGVRSGDIIESIYVNSVEYPITRTFQISDIMTVLRAENSVSIKYLRGGESVTTQSYKIKTSDLK